MQIYTKEVSTYGETSESGFPRCTSRQAVRQRSNLCYSLVRIQYCAHRKELQYFFKMVELSGFKFSWTAHQQHRKTLYLDDGIQIDKNIAVYTTTYYRNLTVVRKELHVGSFMNNQNLYWRYLMAKKGGGKKC